jgi:transposase
MLERLESQRILQEAGCEILFLLPYSSGLNPIEKFWKNMKRKVRELLSSIPIFAAALDVAIVSM